MAIQSHSVVSRDTAYRTCVCNCAGDRRKFTVRPAGNAVGVAFCRDDCCVTSVACRIYCESAAYCPYSVGVGAVGADGIRSNGSPAWSGSDCRYISVKPFAFCPYGNIL